MNRIFERIIRSKQFVGVLSGVLVTAFTGYVLLDTFVISDVYDANASVDSSSAFALAQRRLAGEEIPLDETEESADESAASDDTGTKKPDGAGSSDRGAKGNSGSGSHAKPGNSSKRGRSGSQSSDSGSSQKGSSAKESQSGSANSQTADTGSDSANAVTQTSESSGKYQDYSDGKIKISLKEYTVNNTQVYVADVQVTSAEYLKTAFANNTYGKNVTAQTSTIAAQNNAILAINGDYYGAQESGYVIRNGKVYRATANSATDICCIYADGTMKIKNTSEVTAQELVNEGVWQAFSFGPALVENGSVSVSAGEEVGRAMASNPRTAIGVISANHYMFVVSDGRTSESEGLSLSELAQFMQSLGVSCAYNLDGGGSSTMYYRGEVVNNPTTNGNSIKERNVSDIVYIG